MPDFTRIHTLHGAENRMHTVWQDGKLWTMNGKEVDKLSEQEKLRYHIPEISPEQPSNIFDGQGFSEAEIRQALMMLRQMRAEQQTEDLEADDEPASDPVPQDLLAGLGQPDPKPFVETRKRGIITRTRGDGRSTVKVGRTK